ncbi:MAG: glutamate racemase [Candidatus Kapabacteria bacterium]|jgi:glutamate racemase|nr:glutamate racemase [Candidatus Kapabacteria bacterium]
MSNQHSAIGLFDSGIGGLSVLKQFVRFLPGENFIYLGDTARVPYGNKSRQTVIEYSKQCTNFLLNQDVKLIVVACNTASSVALDVVQEMSSVPVIGMITPAARAAILATQNSKIGIIGTRATVTSRAHQDEIHSLAGDREIEVFAKSCPLFVPLVEEGMLHHNVTRQIAEEYLGEFEAHGIDTLVLGCTHYPLLRQLIGEILPNVELIDPGELAAIKAIRLLAENGLLADDAKIIGNQPNADFYVTDIPDTFFDIANIFLGFPVRKPQKVDLE